MSTVDNRPLTIAVPKGRILEELIPLFSAAGIDLSPLVSESRKLMFDAPDGSYRLLLLRATDVPTYVAYGVADVGVSGSDTLLEDRTDLLEPLDLGVGRCRMVLAVPKANQLKTIDAWTKIATKYPNLARDYFRGRGIDPIIVKLYGAVELACIAGLADVVVDLVSSGATLRANGLVELETIVAISSRLVVNRASAKTKYSEVNALINALSVAVKSEGVG